MIAFYGLQNTLGRGHVLFFFLVLELSTLPEIRQTPNRCSFTQLTELKFQLWFKIVAARGLKLRTVKHKHDLTPRGQSLHLYINSCPWLWMFVLSSLTCNLYQACLSCFPAYRKRRGIGGGTLTALLTIVITQGPCSPARMLRPNSTCLKLTHHPGLSSGLTGKPALIIATFFSVLSWHFCIQQLFWTNPHVGQANLNYLCWFTPLPCSSISRYWLELES